MGDVEQRDIASTLYGQADLYYVQGKYFKAEPLCKEALAIQEHVLGSEHPDVATSLHLLALIYGGQRKSIGKHTEAGKELYTQAEQLYLRALSIWQKEFGPEHPDVAECLSNLGVLYLGQGNYTQAEPLLQQALAIREKVSGESRDLVLSIDFLANLYITQGRDNEAVPLLQRGLHISEQVLGLEHPYTAGIFHQLGRAYCHQGKYTESEQCYQKALAICEQTLGREHPDLVALLRNYAVLLHSMQRDEEAAQLERQAEEIRMHAVA